MKNINTTKLIKDFPDFNLVYDESDTSKNKVGFFYEFDQRNLRQEMQGSLSMVTASTHRAFCCFLTISDNFFWQLP